MAETKSLIVLEIKTALGMKTFSLAGHES